MNKRGLSVVVASVLMIVLVMASVVIIWGVVRNIIEERTGEAEDCSKVAGFNNNVMINDDYTCYNATNGSVYISIALTDQPIDALIISVEYAGSSKGFELTNEVQYLSDVKNYPNYDGGVKLPAPNNGQTYYFVGFTGADSIQISPKVGTSQCDVTDQVTQIESCEVMANL